MVNLKLDSHIRAGNPLIFYRTSELYSAEENIRQAILDMGRTNVQLCVWRPHNGLSIYYAHGDSSEGTRRVMGIDGALEYIIKDANRVGIIFGIQDYLRQPPVLHALLDYAHRARTLFSHFILVGTYLEIPPELAPVLTIVDAPLPSKSELKKQAEHMFSSYQKEIPDFPSSDEEVDELMDNIANSALGLNSRAAENAFALSLAVSGGINLELIQAQKEQEIKKSDALDFIPTDVTMDSVGGFKNLIEWLSLRKKGFTDLGINFGLSYPKGILIVGPPGLGKSLVSKAVANYLGLPLLRLDMGRVFNKYVGSSEAAIHQALKIVEAVSPCVLQIEEFDKGLSGSTSSGDLDAGVTARVISALLTWRQETKAPVFLVATANDPRSLPPMFYRKGRLDAIWGVYWPQEYEREEIFRIHLKKRKQNVDSFSLCALAAASDHFTGAEIESAVEDALFTAFSQNGPLTTSHIIESLATIFPQYSKEGKEMENLTFWMRTYTRSV
jgi:AAA+ superfamily predicted ATPase